jgi:hypothetical protein
MSTAHIVPLSCRLAVSREELGDGKQWSLYLLNDMPCLLDATLDRISYEWGASEQSVNPAFSTRLQPGGFALLWRESSDGAEVNTELSIRVHAPGHNATLRFELGRLYRKQAPTNIEGLGKLGWLQPPAQQS